MLQLWNKCGQSSSLAGSFVLHTPLPNILEVFAALPWAAELRAALRGWMEEQQGQAVGMGHQSHSRSGHPITGSTPITLDWLLCNNNWTVFSKGAMSFLQGGHARSTFSVQFTGVGAGTGREFAADFSRCNRANIIRSRDVSKKIAFFFHLDSKCLLLPGRVPGLLQAHVRVSQGGSSDPGQLGETPGALPFPTWDSLGRQPEPIWGSGHAPSKAHPSLQVKNSPRV